MFCPVCGAHIIEGEDTCRYCGYVLEAEELEEAHAEDAGAEEIAGAEAEDTNAEDAGAQEATVKERDFEPIPEGPFWGVGGWGDERFLMDANVDTVEPNEFIGSLDAVETLRPLPSHHRGESGEVPISKIAGVALPIFAVVLIFLLIISRPFFKALEGKTDVQTPIIIPEGVKVEPPEGEEGAEGEESAEGEGENAEAEGEGEEGAEAGDEQVSEDGIVIRAGLWEYSWAELKSIAELMEKCESREQAIEIAKVYNLADSTGLIHSDFKEVTLANDDSFYVRLVDIWHDDAETDSQKAGMTFISTRPVHACQMGSTEVAAGGWERCSVRSWLVSRLFNELPYDLRDAIIPTKKVTNNVGIAESAECVTSTNDPLWIPSLVELTGNVELAYEEDPDKAGLLNEVLNAEGGQYEAYNQEHVGADHGNSELAVSDSGWWLRSVEVTSGKPRFVGSDGSILEASNANETRGVIFGFCI